MPLYYIATIVPEPLQSEITAFKNDIYQRFGAKSALKSAAHITLFPPFRWEKEEENVLKTALEGFSESIAQKKGPLSIKLKNFGFFRKTTIFVEPEPNENLSILRGKLLAYLSTHINLRDDKDAARPFHPHITIVNRDISEADFDEIWAEYSAKVFDNQFVMDNISLLRLDGERWKVVASYS
jgi:2'-5' RNA ligase